MRRWAPFAIIVLAGCSHPVAKRPTAPLTPFQEALVGGERDQLTWGTGYDGRYYTIGYPGGDVPRNIGVCTDVVVRTYRHVGIDLQKLVHEDMERNWKAYPRYKGCPRPDPNIDHRRVPNQMAFFRRHGVSLTTNPVNPADWKPGDVVDWIVGGRSEHTGMLSDRYDADGFPLVIHNMGSGPHEEDALRAWGWKVTGHFRYPKP